MNLATSTCSRLSILGLLRQSKREKKEEKRKQHGIMSQTGEDLGPARHLNVFQRDVAHHHLTHFRNSITIHAAILRGDDTVLLDGTDRITPNLLELVRSPFPINHPYGQEHLSSWAGYHHVEPSDHIYPSFLSKGLSLAPEQVWDGFHMRFVRVIGRGGFGIATLWDIQFEDLSTIQVVLKSGQASGDSFERDIEEGWHIRYQNAAHIVQVIDLNQRAQLIRQRLPPGQPHIYQNERAFWDPKDYDVIVLEYAVHGSLYQCITHVFHRKIALTNKQLWQIWECRKTIYPALVYTIADPVDSCEGVGINRLYSNLC